jgi:hypothetical protein
MLPETMVDPNPLIGGAAAQENSRLSSPPPEVFQKQPCVRISSVPVA